MRESRTSGSAEGYGEQSPYLLNTDYYPKKLVEFGERCQRKLDEIKARIAV